MLEAHPFKLSISDILKSCKDEFSDIRKLKLTTSSGKMKVLQINHVWVQGRVDTVHEKTDKLSYTLKDETGSIRITHNGNDGAPWITPGVYCSVVGKVTEDSVVPRIEALKMTNLSRNPVFERMWPLEVNELKLFFLGLMEPKLVACKDVDMDD